MTRRIRGGRARPPHLPRPPRDPQAYRRLYRFNPECDALDWFPREDWREIRLRPGMPAEAVYRLLPAAPDFEYTGYLTRTRIRYAAGEATWTVAASSRPCSFHSHATASPSADLPSATDVYQFLRGRHLRAVTVGATKIWAFDKTAATLKVVVRLARWERHCPWFRLPWWYEDAPEGWKADGLRDTTRRALQAFRALGGLPWPDDPILFGKLWPDVLEHSLKIRVTILER